MTKEDDNSNENLDTLLGEYTHPQGYLEYISTLPFLGRLKCSTPQIEAGSWQSILLDYEVGASGLADSAWIKVTFKFYSDWALFQTEDPLGANYVSAEYQARPTLPGESHATVPSLKVRFDQKGHERPYQKAIIVDIIDGYLKPGDHIFIRLGDRRAGGIGTRVQTFVEEGFRFRAYIDPVGTSRFAAIPGDVVIDIVPGSPAFVTIVTPRLVKTGVSFPVRIRVEDIWGNTCWNLGGQLQLISRSSTTEEQTLNLPTQGWAVAKTNLTLNTQEETVLQATLIGTELQSNLTPVIADSNLAYPRAFFADLHVHSNNTVGTNSTEYNFTYGRDVAGLDVLGYTANDFNITEKQWQEDVKLCRDVTTEGEFLCYPGTEWCGNSAAGGDRNVVFLGEEVLFPYDRQGKQIRSFEWNEHMKGNELQPGAWPVDHLYKAYIHAPEQHLLIPHVGGRRAIFDWHHPKLERLIEIGSAWGHFPWFYQDAISRGYKVGVSANGDEHRGRCGGGVPGTAVFGVNGGVTGILAPSLTKAAINQALRSRHTWATTGERIVALLWCNEYIQGDELVANGSVTIHYRFLGTSGWDEIRAYTDQGLLWHRNLQAEAGYAPNRIRLRWGGARIKDRYRSSKWRGVLEYSNTLVESYRAYGLEHPEEYVRQDGSLKLEFCSDTYGDSDTLELELSDLSQARFRLRVEIDSYSKVSSPLQRSPYIHCPEFFWEFKGLDLLEQGCLRQELGGAEMFVTAERLSAKPLAHDLGGSFTLQPMSTSYGFVPIYLFGRQVDDSKAWTSPLFITFTDTNSKND
ncbi:hypothetical protein G7B40_035090 [Aetokthonos hydrillicola Thurmond2011]|uniref:DUF3604 domain-containing protein n=1 Tax=Aetokthonos hydrillicola Thurmond2011 TaxID=2712845 RepID=A0AAP5IDY7_9CYAN|nr:hypothetical protein [Aetokthonos hydrillicola]MBW4590426.1 hypothetical protein [Aetokthonos hydrillicola CCALA 1050]MDR9899746.1 hypothetical protein [Aetokthonos hydrillicola Thurmond2011]